MLQSEPRQVILHVCNIKQVVSVILQLKRNVKNSLEFRIMVRIWTFFSNIL